MSGKPPGIGLTMTGGVPHFYVTPIDRVADRIWDAVRDAIDANMQPEQFKREVIAAWRSHLKDDAERAAKELSR